jgi:hypothetical protein
MEMHPFKHHRAVATAVVLLAVRVGVEVGDAPDKVGFQGLGLLMPFFVGCGAGSGNGDVWSGS